MFDLVRDKVLKDNAIYEARREYDIPDDADSGVLKDEEVILYYGQNKKEEHRARRIAYGTAKMVVYLSLFPITLC
jgi:hypothetical protein